MPRAASLSQASKVNRRKAGKPSGPGGGGGVNLPNLPQFEGPPPGTFDPGLEAEVRAAERGLIDLIEKTRKEGRRESVDTRQARILLERKVRQGQADIARRRGYSIQDAGTDRNRLGTSFQRDLEDLAIAKQRGEADYQRKLGELQSSYATRAATQEQASVAQGTAEAGTEAASAAVRGANQAHDKGLLDEAHTRFLSDNALAEARDREDFASRSGLIDQGLERQLRQAGIDTHRLNLEQRTQRAQLHKELARGVIDRHDLISKSKREYGIYATDVAQQAFYQAHQLNPSIVFPGPTGGTGGAGHPHAVGPAIGPGHAPARPVVPGAPIRPHPSSIAGGVGFGPSRPSLRRPYRRY